MSTVVDCYSAHSTLSTKKIIADFGSTLIILNVDDFETLQCACLRKVQNSYRQSLQTFKSIDYH